MLMQRKDLPCSPGPRGVGGALAVMTWLFGQVAWAAPAVEELVPYGVRADPRPVPPGLLTSDTYPDEVAAQAKSNVFYLNYDGVTIKHTGGEDDSSQNISQFPDFAATYQPYGQGAKRAASMQAVQSDWSKYKVVITDQRPNAGNYTMCVNSPTTPFGDGVLGVAPLDCNDQQARNVVFAYHQANDQFSAATQATTMSQEIAHAFGLEHVKEPNDIMNPYNAGGDPSFLDKCLALDGGGMGILCNSQHDQFCGGGGQNSHAELVWLFGLGEPDAQPPTVAVTFPTEGQVFNALPMFSLLATASDNVEVSSVEFFLDGQSIKVDASDPYSQPLDGVPAGSYTVWAVATDSAQNTTKSVEVHFTVGGSENPSTTEPATTADPPETSNGEGDTGGDSNSSAPTEGTASASVGDEGGLDTGGDTDQGSGIGSGPALPPGYGQDGEGGCRVAPRTVPLAGLLVLVLAGLGRRRRRAA
jgi:hypothetical protein